MLGKESGIYALLFYILRKGPDHPMQGTPGERLLKVLPAYAHHRPTSKLTG